MLHHRARDRGQAGLGLPYVDSLKAVLEYMEQHPQTAETTLKIRYAAALAYAIGRKSTDSAMALVERYLPLIQLHPKSCESYALRNSLAYVLLFSGKIDTSLQIIEQNIQILEKIGSCFWELGQAHHLRGIAEYLVGSPDTAVVCYERAIAYREAVRDLRGLGDSYNNLATIYKLRSNYDKALTYNERALQVRIQLQDSQGIADSYGNIATIYYEKGLYPIALDKYLKAEAIFEKINDIHALSYIWINIAAIYRNQKQYTDAYNYLQRAISIQENLHNYYLLASAYNALANLYMDKENNLDSALAYYEKSLKIYEAIRNKISIFTAYNNIAGIFLNKGNWALAMDYYRRGIAIAREAGMRGKLGVGYSNLAGVYLVINRPHAAYPLLLEAEKIAIESNEREYLSGIYSKLSKAESLIARNDRTPQHYLRALEYLHKHIALRDSLFNQENVRMLERLQNQYVYEKKESLLRAEREAERLLAQARIRQREMQRNYSLIGLVVALVGIGILLFLLRIIRRQKSTLQTVNAQLEVANAELAATNDALEVTNRALTDSNKALEESNRIIQAQKEVLEEKNRDILDSITYAKRIQEALLPPAEKWQVLVPEAFVLYLPRDIVAGDFYWLAETNRYIYIAAADATGHGVPGAFVSMICVTTLQKVVHEEGLESPADILMRSKELITSQLTQYDKGVRDGMDIALLRLSKSNPREIVFSGANRPLWISKYSEIIEISPTKQPIGFSETVKPFEDHHLILDSPSMLYLFTDGLVDQMGGPRGRKLMSKGLREYLLSIAHLSPSQQGQSLRSFFESWRGDHPQMDDVTIIGVHCSAA